MNQRQYSFAELSRKSVINVADGKELGKACDLIFNSCGSVCGIVVPGKKKPTEKYHERGNDIYRLESYRKNRSGRNFGGIGGKLRLDDERRNAARARAKQGYFLLNTRENKGIFC